MLRNNTAFKNVSIYDRQQPSPKIIQTLQEARVSKQYQVFEFQSYTTKNSLKDVLASTYSRERTHTLCKTQNTLTLITPTRSLECKLPQIPTAAKLVNFCMDSSTGRILVETLFQ